MRLDAPFVYRITKMPKSPPPIFQFLMDAGPIDVREAYATFNMGAGFAVYLPQSQADVCIQIATKLGYEAWIAGSVFSEKGRKAVEIEPLKIAFESDTLQLR